MFTLSGVHEVNTRSLNGKRARLLLLNKCVLTKLEIAPTVIKSVSPVKYSTGSSWSVRDSSVIFFARQFSFQLIIFMGKIQLQSQTGWALTSFVAESLSGVLRTQKLKTHLLRAQSSKIVLIGAWGRSEYSHACFIFRQGFLP